MSNVCELATPLGKKQRPHFARGFPLFFSDCTNCFQSRSVWSAYASANTPTALSNRGDLPRYPAIIEQSPARA